MTTQARTSISVQAPWRAVYELAAAVERWPELLPHYRWVRVLACEEESRVVEMAARRGFWPLRWTARVTPRPGERRLYFEHLKGPTRGMRVWWEFRPCDGGTEVTIVHEMTLERPLLRTAPGRWVVVHVFIHPVARRTLACMKRAAEVSTRVPRPDSAGP